jgi:hypothetical protein
MIPNTVQISNRFTATVVHFFISLVVFIALIGILLFSWYPSPYFSASGGWQGLRLVAAVDLVLGPLMTLIIFNPQKSRRELAVDLGLVVLLQLAALGCGIKAVYEQRPVAVVFLDSNFYTVPALAITSQGIDLDVLDPFGEERPVLVYAERPKEEGEDFARFAMAVREQRVPPHEQAWLYRSLSDNFSTVVRSTLEIEEIVTNNAAMSAELERLLERTQSEMQENYYLALTSRYRNIVLVFDVAGYLLGSISAPYKTGEL